MQTVMRAIVTASTRLTLARVDTARALATVSSNLSTEEAPSAARTVWLATARIEPLSPPSSSLVLTRGSVAAPRSETPPARASTIGHVDGPTTAGRAADAACARAALPDPSTTRATAHTHAHACQKNGLHASAAACIADLRPEPAVDRSLALIVASAAPPLPSARPSISPARASVDASEPRASTAARVATSVVRGVADHERVLAPATLGTEAADCSLEAFRHSSSAQISASLGARSCFESADRRSATTSTVYAVVDAVVESPACERRSVDAPSSLITDSTHARSRAGATCRAHVRLASLTLLAPIAGGRASAESPPPDAMVVLLPAPTTIRVAVAAASTARPLACVTQAPSGRSRSRYQSTVTADTPEVSLRSSAPPFSRAHLLPPGEPRGRLIARPHSRASLRIDAYAAKNPLLYNACIAGVASATTARLTGLKLYRAVSRAAAVAQAVDRVVPVDPLLTTARGHTTLPSEATTAAHHDRSWAMFRTAYAASGGPAAYDVERLAARVARDYIEEATAPARKLLEELRARSVDAPGIERAVARLPSTPARSSAAQALHDDRRDKRRKSKNQARMQAPQKLVGRRYVVGSARVTVTGYDPRTGRFQCTTDDGDAVSYTLAELSG